ncbi:MAG: hypothetical protein QXJ56_07900 [Ignisphaera sp.]
MAEESSDIWRDLPEELRPTRPRETFYANFTASYTPRKLTAVDNVTYSLLWVN